MGRSDQYIGLNKIATEYIKEMSITCTLVKREDIEVVEASDTLCGCPIYGSKWIFVDKEGDFITLTEVVQETPWSSGPMYFTCLSNGSELIGQWRYNSEGYDYCSEFNSVDGVIYL